MEGGHGEEGLEPEPGGRADTGQLAREGGRLVLWAGLWASKEAVALAMLGSSQWGLEAPEPGGAVPELVSPTSRAEGKQLSLQARQCWVLPAEAVPASHDRGWDRLLHRCPAWSTAPEGPSPPPGAHGG